MSKNETQTAEKVPFKAKVGNLVTDIKTHWNTPAEGKYVPYKEYISIFFAVGGDYSSGKMVKMLTFTTSCYLIAFYYEIPILTFTAINALFLVGTYFWNILSWGVDANLGIMPKKTERKYDVVYLAFTIIGLALVIFDFSTIIPWPESLKNYLDTSWPGLNMYNILKIIGAHWIASGWGGFRSIVIRKLFLKKLGRYKLFAYANVIQCLVVGLLICELPLYELPLYERIWKIYLLFQLYVMFYFVDFTTSVADNISPNPHERMLIRCYPVKLSHGIRSLFTFLLPTIAGALFTNGIRDRGTYQYLLPIFIVLSAVLMFIGLGNVKERIPQPPIEKKKYFSFWECIDGIMHNKYLWIRQISVLLDSLGNGMLGMKEIILIYTWRETGFFYALAEQLISFIGNPGALLAPWIRKRFQYKQLIIFQYLVSFCTSGCYILAILFLGTMHKASAVVLFLILLLNDALQSAIRLASDDMKIRISDYQMYISGERFEAYQGVVSWFTNPISSLISLIIPLIFYRIGFTADRDVLFVDSVRLKCMLVGIAFDMAGYILMAIPYLLFWDYTDEKHAEVMRVLQERADAAEAEMVAEQSAANGEPVAVAESVGGSDDSPTVNPPPTE